MIEKELCKSKSLLREFFVLNKTAHINILKLSLYFYNDSFLKIPINLHDCVHGLYISRHITDPLRIQDEVIILCTIFPLFPFVKVYQNTVVRFYVGFPFKLDPKYKKGRKHFQRLS